MCRALFNQNEKTDIIHRVPLTYTVPRPMEPRVFHGFKLTAPLNSRSNFVLCRVLMHAVRCGFDGVPKVRFGAV